METVKKRDYTLRISCANRCGLVAIVYEICLDYLHEAKGFCAKNDIEAFRVSLDKARDCIVQQMSSLDMTQPLSGNLMSLYLYCIRELAKADRTAEVTPIAHVESVITKLMDAFLELSKVEGTTPVMEKAQEVYAGFTYGTTGLNEDVLSSENRGFMA